MLSANWVAITLFSVLFIAVLVKKDKRNTDRYLIASILCIISYLIGDIWVHYSLTRLSFAFHAISSYAVFPPFFFYAMLLISKQHTIRKSWWWFMVYHFAYFIFIILDVFVLHDYSQQDVSLLYHGPSPRWRPYLFFYKGLQIYTIVIMGWFLTRLNRYQKLIKDYYSNVEAVRLDWLKNFSWIYIFAYSTAFVAHLAYNFRWVSNVKVAYLITTISLILGLFWMFYNGLRQHVLANFSEADTTRGNSKKYATSSLTNESANKLYKRITVLFEAEKIFHNPELKVQDIAEKLDATNHNISQVLNEIAGKSFYDFVNDYRLQYFKEQLADPENKRFTILALGMESGFNSKASINRVFKQQLGVTPREYQQKIITSQEQVTA